MEPLFPASRFIIILGISLVFLGLILQFMPQLPYLGHLPGDLRIEEDNYSFYFPITSCLILSLVLNLLLRVFS